MKGLVLLYRSEEEITVREYSKVEEQKNYYIVGENCLRKEGILKKYVGEVCKYISGEATCKGTYIAKYPIDIPYMRNMYWRDGYFIFVNKKKYDADPQLYYDIIKNYREE